MTDGRPARGFTLIEVLVALVIVALGMLAVFTQLNQTVSTATRLREKTLAHWIALDQLTQMRVARDVMNEYPAIGDRSDEVEFAGGTWRYTIHVAKAGDVEAMRRIDVTVAYPDAPDQTLATLTGFLLEPQQGAPPQATADWVPIDPDNPQAAGRNPGQNSGQNPGQNTRRNTGDRR